MKSQILTRYAARFMSGTALSRLFGLGRDIAMASIYGTSAPVAAFFIAYRFANLFRRIFAEGGLLNGFVPHYQQIEPKKAHPFFIDLTASLTTLLVALIAIGATLSLFFESEILHLTTKMLPSLLFICLYGLFSAYLHCENHFFTPGFAPVAFNVVWIVGLLFHPSISMLCLIVVAAFATQWLFVAIPTLKITPYSRPKLFTPQIRQMIAPFVIATLGLCAAQVNSALDVLFASLAHPEGPAYLSYGIRIQQLPLSLFAISMATALLPTLSKSTSEQAHHHLMHAMSRTLFFLIPATFGIWATGGVIVNLLFGRGAFDLHSVIHTTHAFWGYALALVPTGLVILIAPMYYAKKDYKTPTIIAAFCIGVNVVLNALFILVLKFGPSSVAISTAIAMTLNAALLLRPYRIDLATKQLLAKVSLASLGATLITIGVIWGLNLPALLPLGLSFGPELTQNISSQLIFFAIPFIAFLVSYVFLNIIVKIPFIYGLKKF